MTTRAILAATALGLVLCCGESLALDLKDNTNTSGSSTLNAKDKKVFVPLKKTGKFGDSTGKIDSAVNGLRSNTPAQYTGKSQRVGQKKKEAGPSGSPASQSATALAQSSAGSQKTQPKVYRDISQDPEIRKKICPPGSPSSCDPDKLLKPPSIENLFKLMQKGTQQ